MFRAILCATFLAGFYQVAAAQDAAQPFVHPSDDANYGATQQPYNALAPAAGDEDAPQVQVTDNGRVKYISGGVSDSGMQAINSRREGYNLEITLVGDNGMYLADVGVHVTDRQGAVLLDTSTKGPVLLAQLPPGAYTLSATAEGITRTQRVKIGQRLSSYTLRFPIHET